MTKLIVFDWKAKFAAYVINLSDGIEHIESSNFLLVPYRFKNELDVFQMIGNRPIIIDTVHLSGVFSFGLAFANRFSLSSNAA